MISVAMATYNGAKYIREQIDSILNQTIQDIELVICDDCSSDDTIEILEAYANRDTRVIVYSNSHNLGFKKNFENVISKCRGKFIALADQDDIWYPNHLELLMNAMDDSCQLVCGKPEFVDENNCTIPVEFNYFKMNLPPNSNEGHARHIFLDMSTYQGAAMLARNTFFEKSLPIPDGVNYHDSWFAALACFLGGINYVNTPILRYRRHSDSITIRSKGATPFRHFAGQVLVNHSLTDRLAFVDGVRNRAGALSQDQRRLLMTFEKLLKRRKTIWGRLLNVPYYLCHFKEIYATNVKDIFSF